jgi:hypothetical protein
VHDRPGANAGANASAAIEQTTAMVPMVPVVPTAAEAASAAKAAVMAMVANRGARANKAAIANDTGAAMAAMTGLSRLLTAQQGDADDREKHRDPKYHSAIHPRILQLQIPWRKQLQR